MSLNTLHRKKPDGDIVSKECQMIAEDFENINSRDILQLIRYHEKQFVVFLDTNSELHWKTSPEFDSHIKNEDEIERVIARIILLQNNSTAQFLSKKKKLFLGRMLGEALVQQFIGDSLMTETCINQASEYLSKRKSELSKKWQILSGIAGLLLFSAVFVALHTGLQRIDTDIKDYIYFFMYAYFGAVGAFLSVIQKSHKATIDCEAGCSLVFLDTGVKLLVGVISAFIALCFTQIDMVGIGFMANGVDKGKISLILVCIVAGFSERLMPSIVGKVEKAVGCDDIQLESDTR